MNILVTGGAGFIGSHTCKALAQSGHCPVTLDNLTTGHRDNVRWGPFVEGDVRDADTVAAAIREHDIEAIVHFAASAYVGESVEKPALYYDNNVGGMLGLLRGARETGVERIVFSSSCATYGIPDTLPIREDAPQQPINPYGRTKLIGEQMLRDFSAAYGTRHVVLRYFNACGADPEGELTERHDPETHLIPLALMAASGRAPALRVFGTDYPTPDGTCVRDYIHVADLARGHLKALDWLARGKGSIEVNLGSGTGHSIREVLDRIASLAGCPVPCEFGPRRPGDPPVLYADPSAALDRLGFVTERSDLDSIIRDAAPGFGLELSNG